jgi:hypothetical protein
LGTNQNILKMNYQNDLRATFGHVTYEDGYVYPIEVQILGYLITGCTLIWIPVTEILQNGKIIQVDLVICDR